MTSIERPVFDAHVHVERGLDDYDLPIAGKNVIYNYLESYHSLVQTYRNPADTVTLIVDASSDAEFIAAEAASGRIDALKIHSRISKIEASGWPAIRSFLKRVPAQLPVVIDAFYYGRELEYQPSLPAIVDILAEYPERKFIVAHSGGYRMLEYFFHLREFENCYYELALSLQYLEDSSVFADLKKLLKYTDKSRIVYGSDFPFASPKRQFDILLAVCRELAMPDADVDRILYQNAMGLFRREGERITCE